MFRTLSTMIVVIAMAVMGLSGYGVSPIVWAAGTSVNCAKAQTWAERTICKSGELTGLERQMTAVFEQLRDTLSGVARSDQVIYQRGFLQGRDICRTQVQNITPQECLKRIYQDRIAELENYLAAVSIVAVSAQDAVGGDCRAGAASRAETIPCLQLELDRVNADLSVAAEDVRGRMREMDKANRVNINAEQRFANSQETFLKFRQASCEWQAAIADSDRALLACMVDLTRTRVAEIEAVFSN